MNYSNLPVYQHKDKILQALQTHQVVIVESPTGSGKTTGLPIILHEAGYTKNGVVGVTQPRRIATISVSDFIAKSLNQNVGELVGYKMRFEDKTSKDTLLKIMTDGILLQEIKLDPYLYKYSVIMVDEAHERSLNIDFILGLLKQILKTRSDLKVIISSATINSAVFSHFFNNAPVVSIETSIFPVMTIYSPLKENTDEELVSKITDLCEKIILEDKRGGDILIFLPGEKIIKMTINSLYESKAKKKIWALPLYGMLGKEEQEQVFIKAPMGKTKIIVSTNIAETSVTIDGITNVIDSGRSKENRYNLRTYTSSLIDTTISKASANQRKGRAGRTQSGNCYRLYNKDDFDLRPSFTLEEIYRTDLSEVVLHMASLGIKDFMRFEFISQPSYPGISSSIETLKLLEALNNDGSLTKIGDLMIRFPLLPRHAKIMVEAILHYPSVLSECAIITSFLSTNQPYLLPLGEELEARKAHHHFRGKHGDFDSYINLYNSYINTEDKSNFCKNFYLDEKTMEEICNIKNQLEEVASDNGAIISGGGSPNDYLVCCGKGLIQFVCKEQGRNAFKSLTTDNIIIHPGSVMFKEKIKFMIAGEIMKTTRLYARSVAPISFEILKEINSNLADQLDFKKTDINSKYDISPKQEKPKIKNSNMITIGSTIFELEISSKKRKKILKTSYEKIKTALEGYKLSDIEDFKTLCATVVYKNEELFINVKLNSILKVIYFTDLKHDIITTYPRTKQYHAHITAHFEKIASHIKDLGKLCFGNKKGKNNQFLGFLSLCNDGKGAFWFKPMIQFNKYMDESLGSVELLADTWPDEASKEAIESVSSQFRKLNDLSEA